MAVNRASKPISKWEPTNPWRPTTAGVSLVFATRCASGRPRDSRSSDTTRKQHWSGRTTRIHFRDTRMLHSQDYFPETRVKAGPRCLGSTAQRLRFGSVADTERPDRGPDLPISLKATLGRRLGRLSALRRRTGAALLGARPGFGTRAAGGRATVAVVERETRCGVIWYPLRFVQMHFQPS